MTEGANDLTADVLSEHSQRKAQQDALSNATPEQRKAAKAEQKAAKKDARQRARAARTEQHEHAKRIDEAVRAYVKDHKPDRIERMDNVHLFPDRVIRTPLGGLATVYPLTGVEAELEETGTLSSRSTLTRGLVPGLHGWQKKTDDRRVYLLVTGPDFAWRIYIGPKDPFGITAQFADRINVAARQ